ncbi:MAG: Gfo/Idh/MocA family protein [Puniceicoccaceae bacterium]
MKQRIYIIGAGAISHQHATARKALPRETELYVADPNPQAREKFLESFPDAILFETSDAMLAHAPATEHDIVVVATPPRFHCPETLKALQSGRNVVCEKPFAMNLEEARQMVETAKAAGLHVSCCSNRFLGWSANTKMRELIEDGAIGEPYLVDFQHRSPCSRTGVEYQNGSWWFLDNSMNGGGPLFDWGPYDLAVLLDIFQPVQVTVADAVVRHIDVRHGIPDDVVFDIETHTAATVRFVMEDGKAVTIRYERGCCLHGEAYEIEGVYGTGGYLAWDWIPFGDQLHVRLKKTMGPDEADETAYPAVDYPEGDGWAEAPLREFDRYLRGDASARVIVNEKALQSFQLLGSIYEVSETGQPVTLQLTSNGK